MSSNSSLKDNILNNRYIPRIFGLVIMLVVWIVIAFFFPARIFPLPHELVAMTWEIIEKGSALPQLITSLWRIFLGFLGAMAIGISIGVFMGMNEYSRKFFTPYVVAGLSVPAIAWAAISTIVFGFTIAAPVVAAALTTFPYIAVNVWKGVEAIEPDLLEMSEAFKVSRFRVLYRLILPNAAPELFSAFRFGLAISWKIVLVAEFFASGSGIGYKMVQAYAMLDFKEVWAWAFLFIIFYLAIEFLVFRPLQKRAFSYRPDTELTF